MLHPDITTSFRCSTGLSQLMPAWSIAEWRARIGSSWCALGRPIKTRSFFSNGARMRQRVFSWNQVVTLMILMVMLIGLNLGLRALLGVRHNQPLLSE